MWIKINQFEVQQPVTSTYMITWITFTDNRMFIYAWWSTVGLLPTHAVGQLSPAQFSMAGIASTSFLGGSAIQPMLYECPNDTWHHSEPSYYQFRYHKSTIRPHCCWLYVANYQHFRSNPTSTLKPARGHADVPGWSNTNSGAGSGDSLGNCNAGRARRH